MAPTHPHMDTTYGRQTLQNRSPQTNRWCRSGYVHYFIDKVLEGVCVHTKIHDNASDCEAGGNVLQNHYDKSCENYKYVYRILQQSNIYLDYSLNQPTNIYQP